VVIFENLYCLNALSGGTIQDTLASPKWRLVFAAMIRESTEVCMEGKFIHAPTFHFFV
jgi:hypothetical protein